MGHVLWLDNRKLGKVNLMNSDPRGKYQWEAGGRTGFAEALDKAKAAVEAAAASAETQLDLFK
jgi:hypothetical protein